MQNGAYLVNLSLALIGWDSKTNVPVTSSLGTMVYFI